MSEQIEPVDRPVPVFNKADDRPASQRCEIRTDSRLVPQAGEADCGCGPVPDPERKSATPASYVYAIGRVEARFPNLAAEKEFAQAGGRTDTAGKTDQQTFHAVLTSRENRYLTRQLCWVLTIRDWRPICSFRAIRPTLVCW